MSKNQDSNLGLIPLYFLDLYYLIGGRKYVFNIATLYRKIIQTKENLVKPFLPGLKFWEVLFLTLEQSKYSGQ